jgi:hypothetical protein
MRALLLAVMSAAAVCPAIMAETAATAALTADQIMSKVAANQDRTEAARTHYVYLQHIRTVSRKTNGKVMCEEITDSRVIPRANGSHQDMLKLDGRTWKKNQYVQYSHLQKTDDPAHNQAKTEQEDLEGLDIDLVEDLRKDLTNDGSEESDKRPAHAKSAGNGPAADDNSSRDGLAKDLFPLTSKQQKKYLFELEGRQRMNGRDVYHVSFRPKDKGDFDWKGHAFIDTQEFEPVVVYTELSRKIPLAVRTLLGTDLPGLGFSVTYARQPDGVWFPVSFGTEFRMRVLFFLARDISMSLENTHFEKTHSDVKILDGVKVVENAPASFAAPPAPHN